mgnify:CR=1
SKPTNWECKQMQIQKEIKIYSKQEREVKSTTHTLT